MAEAKTFRDKKLPCDAMVYLGTDFCPNGWNTHNGEFSWNSRAFPDPPRAIEHLHADNFRWCCISWSKATTLSER